MYPNHIPSVSIILTSYNHEKFIREAIDSALNQTYTDFELIVWDDASTDASWEIIQSYQDPRIKAFRNEANEMKTINKALASGIVKGSYVAIHHSDDVWDPTKLEKQVAFLEGNPEYGAVFTQVSLISESGLPFEDTGHFYFSVFEQPNRSRHEWLRYFFTVGNALCHPSVLIRRECYEKCGLYPYELRQLPDFAMWIQLAMDYELYILPEKLVQFRVHTNETNISGNLKENRIRGYIEHFSILNQFRKIQSIEDLTRIFPEAREYDRGEDTDILFVLGRVGLEKVSYPMSTLFCLNLLYEAVEDNSRRSNLLEHYGFSYRSLFKISEQYDVFSIEKNIRLNRLLHNQILFSGLYLFSGQDEWIQSYSVEFSPTDSVQKFVFHIDPATEFGAFRWDPVEGLPCSVITYQVKIFDVDGKEIWINPDDCEHNGEKEDKGGFRFYSVDPMQKYKYSGRALRIEINAKIELIHLIDIERRLLEKFYKKEGELIEQYAAVSTLGAELEGYKQLLLAKNDTISELSRSLDGAVQALGERDMELGVLHKGLELSAQALGERDIELGALQEKLSKLEIDFFNLDKEFRIKEKIIHSYVNSWSWKISKPIRIIGTIFNNIFILFNKS